MTLAKIEPRSEIIEVIDDDVDVFGDAASSHQVEDPGGRRYAGPVAAVVLLALIGYGVATSATSTGAPSAAPSTSTASTSPRAPTTIPAATVPYYAASPPRDFTVQYANVQQLDHAPFLGYAYQLWATDGASAASGSWFSVATYRAASRTNVPNAYRVQTDKSSIAISHTPGGQSITQFNVEGRFGVSITSFGWTDDDLVRLAGSVETDGRSVSFADSWFSSDHVMLTSVQPWLTVQSIAAEQISYASSEDPTADVVITAGKRLQTFEGGATPERQIALRFLLDRSTPFDVNGRSGVAGTIVGHRDDAMATWIDGDNVITVTAAMPLPQLIAIARTVHQVSPAEWEGMKFQALRNANAGSRIIPTQASPVASGVDASSQPWTVEATMSNVDGRQQISWRWMGNGFVSVADDTARINTVVDNERTYVLADLPRDIATAAQLLITRSGSDAVVVPFNDAGADIDRTFVAYAFSEPSPYTAQIVGADGAVLGDLAFAVIDNDFGRAREWVRAAKRVTVLTGAGISTDSGIPDFRGPNGLWTKNPAAEKASTLQNYLADPDVRRFAWQNRLHSPAWDAVPNRAHLAIYELERRRQLLAVVTQNIDELHQRGGHEPGKVIEVHGTMRWSRCWTCDDRRPMQETLQRVREGEEDPHCLVCGGVLKSDTVSFGQSLVPEVIDAAMRAADECDVLLAAGSTLSVFPAANVVPRAKASGAWVVIVNGEPTAMDRFADALLIGPLGDLLPALITS